MSKQSFGKCDGAWPARHWNTRMAVQYSLSHGQPVELSQGRRHVITAPPGTCYMLRGGVLDRL